MDNQIHTQTRVDKEENKKIKIKMTGSSICSSGREEKLKPNQKRFTNKTVCWLLIFSSQKNEMNQSKDIATKIYHRTSEKTGRRNKNELI